MSADREQLATALRTMLAVYCGDEGDTPEACQAAERQAREALAAIEPEGGGTMTANMTRDQRERLRQAFIAYVEKLANVKACEGEDRREWAHVEICEVLEMAGGLGIKLGGGEE